MWKTIGWILLGAFLGTVGGNVGTLALNSLLKGRVVQATARWVHSRPPSLPSLFPRSIICRDTRRNDKPPTSTDVRYVYTLAAWETDSWVQYNYANNYLTFKWTGGAFMPEVRIRDATGKTISCGPTCIDSSDYVDGCTDTDIDSLRNDPKERRVLE
jgi:hypothetical protein